MEEKACVTTGRMTSFAEHAKIRVPVDENISTKDLTPPSQAGDAMASPNLVRLCQDVDLAILDCSFSSHAPGQSHMHAEECGKVAKKANIKKLVLSHFYETADRSNVVAQARRFFPGPVIKGKDLLTLQVGRSLPT